MSVSILMATLLLFTPCSQEKVDYLKLFNAMLPRDNAIRCVSSQCHSEIMPFEILYTMLCICSVMIQYFRKKDDSNTKKLGFVPDKSY